MAFKLLLKSYGMCVQCEATICQGLYTFYLLQLVKDFVVLPYITYLNRSFRKLIF